MKVLLKNYELNKKEKLSQNNSSFFYSPQFGTCQNEYYPENLNLLNFCRFTSLQLLIFSISLEMGICGHVEND